ncbi:hypothetical protein BOTBODRAFT_342340 [Botryobasidium botryosum FD-172 SS1]|uniref:RNase H type-1 domain-containing protein n=1 Tax=Botryobasidium botryosum (strain FD-172 SS1) TaxID=930990 RepID=A0A067MG19_BOTB1|nr:hypothetical protein BOTBODRAFT_342340 [Botryobasidium botryosum FD-172 SS1]
MTLGLAFRFFNPKKLKYHLAAYPLCALGLVASRSTASGLDPLPEPHPSHKPPPTAFKVLDLDAAAARTVNFANMFDIAVFSDGCRRQSGVGAAAIAPQCTLRFRLGGHSDYTSMEAEFASIVLALSAIKIHQGKLRTAVIVADSSSAVHTLAYHPNRRRHLRWCALFNTELAKLKRAHPKLELTICRVPSHSGVEGNERADVEAKKAADEDDAHPQALWLRKALDCAVSDSHPKSAMAKTP